MSGLGVQAWVLLLAGLRMALCHSDVMQWLEIARVFGHSYRLASAGIGSGVMLGRFTVGFCKVVVAGAAGHLASRSRDLTRRGLSPAARR